jgi:creatinine amidohydrolase
VAAASVPLGTPYGSVELDVPDIVSHFKNVTYHVRAADALGFQAAIFLTGHYGPNWKDLKTLLDLLQPHVAMRLYGLPDFECNHPGFDGDGASGDHAGKVETSLLWALEPDCVDASRFPEPDAPGEHFAMGRNARESNRRIGERMVEDEVRWLGEKARELLAAYDAAKPRHRPLTFGDVERIWDEVVRPRLQEFETMKPRWGDKEPPEASRWRANWIVPERAF